LHDYANDCRQNRRVEPGGFRRVLEGSDLDGMTYDEIIKAGAATGTKIVGVERHDGPQNAPGDAPQKAPVAASK
jgi:3-deoxy-D-manno-octulosonic acid (KDO) 8-phosphate synthase